MINLSPMRAQVAHTVATGARVHLQLPAPCHKNLFINFVKRNKEFHEPWVYVSSDPKFYDQYLRRMKMGSSLGFFVFTNMGSEFVGVINLNSIRLDPFSSASLGYYADEVFCKKGLMKEGIKLVLGHAFYKIGLNRVEANIQPGNSASQALVKAVGFQKEGFSPKFLQIGNEYKDHERWAYLSDDFN